MDTSQFESAASALGKCGKKMLVDVPESIKANATEIRLRTGRSVCVVTAGGMYFASTGEVTPEMLEDIFLEMCGYSVYSCQTELSRGYVTAPGGHRAGFGCSAVYKNGVLTGIKDISSINLRIARQAKGCARSLCERLFGDGLCGALLIGAPSSGKTTLLRDLARGVSSGEYIPERAVALVDERGELSAMNKGVPGMSLGRSCDVLYGYEKSTAINQAVRCLSPRLIVCDEIGTRDDAEAVFSCVNAGVCVVSSVHASNEKELAHRKHIIRLLETEAFKKLVFLSGADKPSEVSKIVDFEAFRRDFAHAFVADDRA